MSAAGLARQRRGEVHGNKRRGGVVGMRVTDSVCGARLMVIERRRQMRRCGWMLGVGCAIALVIALAGCGRQTTAALGATSGAITAVRIVRSGGFPASHAQPFEATSHDAAAAQGLAQTIRALPDFPSGPMSCPSDSGVQYTLTFLSGAATAMTATVNATGCQGLTIAGESQARRTATGSFWPQVAQTFHVSQSFLWGVQQPAG